MDSLTYNIIIPSPLFLTIGIVGGTALGIVKGFYDRECVDLRSGIKCGLRNFILSMTISSVAAVAWAAFALTAMNTSFLVMSAITVYSVIAYANSGLSVFELANRYEQILKLFLDRLIVTP